MQHGTARAHGDYGQSVWHILGCQRRAFQRVQRDINARTFACSNLFTDVQHRGFVAFAFADHHDTRDIQHVQLGAHGVDCGLVCGLFIPTTDQFCRRDRSGLGYAGKAQRQHTIIEISGGWHGYVPVL